MAARRSSDTKSKETPSQSAAPPLYHRFLPLRVLSFRLTRAFQIPPTFPMDDATCWIRRDVSSRVSKFSHNRDSSSDPSSVRTIGLSCPITGSERNRDETPASYASRSSKRPGKIVGVSRGDPFLGGEVTAWGVTRWAISRKRRSGFKGLARRGGQDRDFRGPLKDTFVCLCQNIGFH